MTSAVVFDTSALDRFQSGFDLEVDWLRNWSEEGLPPEIQRVELGGVVYFLGPSADSDSSLLVMRLAKDELFEGLAAKHRPEAFLRLVRVGRAAHAPGTLPIPSSWLPFHSGSRLSIQTNHLSTGERSRVEVDQNPRATHHCYAYKLDRSKRDLASAVVDYKPFEIALAQYEDAALRALVARDQSSASALSRVVLQPPDDRISMGRSLTEWLSGRLTSAQRAFVDAPLDRSVRLVGAAGTGKTLSLIVKCLSEVASARGLGLGKRFLFLTHSQSSVETVTNAILSMDHQSIAPGSDVFLKICTLQELANDAIKYDLHGLEPLSNDGHEGRAMQLETIQSQINEFRRGEWVTFEDGCSEAFRSGMTAAKGSPEAQSFAYEIMNEFACVLEADGVRQSGEKRERYLTESRKAWMFPLETQDRRVVLKLYDEFRKFLREIGVIGVDQMIADYLGFLDSNRWDNVRQREGYDVVFVDELHLFNRQERMTLHQLMRDVTMPPVVVMAYDTKQSVRDTFYGLAERSGAGTALSREMGLGATTRFELNEGFRYTKEIARVLEWIDQTYPAAGLSEELGADWSPIALGSSGSTGPRPVLYRADSSLEMAKTVFPRAQRAARDLQKGRRVAVLCASEALFKRYVDSGAYRESFLAITDREQLSSLRHAGKRFILSMPEFVAGVQFDSVFLIEANEGEVQQGPYAAGAMRRYVSMLYLGASRAERVLELYSSEERGGPTRALKHAIDNGALDVLEVSDLNG